MEIINLSVGSRSFRESKVGIWFRDATTQLSSE
jgi:hypothetical protein